VWPSGHPTVVSIIITSNFAKFGNKLISCNK
jgi:hypothetical protein